VKTITPFELQMLLDERDVEVIDVRPKNDFERAHAIVARSIPLKQFEPHSVLAHRRGTPDAPIYIFGERNAQASLAACGLASAGLRDPIVVDGGIEAWKGASLPVTGKGFWRKRLARFVRRIALRCRRTSVRRNCGSKDEAHFRMPMSRRLARRRIEAMRPGGMT
jgi:rhodanese-related sulfurtransferase